MTLQARSLIQAFPLTHSAAHTSTHNPLERPTFSNITTSATSERRLVSLTARLSGSTLSRQHEAGTPAAPSELQRHRHVHKIFHRSLTLTSGLLAVSQLSTPPTWLLLTHPSCSRSAPSLLLSLLPPLFSQAQQGTADLFDQPPPPSGSPAHFPIPPPFPMHAESVWSSSGGGEPLKASDI